MGKKTDLAFILTIVIIGMFIPFLGSILINFGLDLTIIDDLLKIGSTFFLFLLIFAIELIVVFIYFQLTSSIASKKIEELKEK